jgi:hypothetical protein
MNKYLQDIQDIIVKTEDLINVKIYLEENKDADIYFRDLVKNNIIELENNCYKRKILFQNDLFEIIGIYWNKNTKTLIHDHADKGCIMSVVSGKLTEYLYDTELNLVKKSKIENINYINNNIGIHCVLANEISSSYHIYAPPNYISNKFN